MEVTFSLTENQIRQLHNLYQNEWWTKGRSLEDTRKCIKGSQICIGLIDENSNLQGFARVITDFTFKALIFDIIIDEKHRNAGLGTTILNLIKTHKELEKVKHFELYCHPDLVEFYAKFGFSSDIDDIVLLRCKNA